MCEALGSIRERGEKRDRKERRGEEESETLKMKTIPTSKTISQLCLR
jgi:hypothetical protein